MLKFDCANTWQVLAQFPIHCIWLLSDECPKDPCSAKTFFLDIEDSPLKTKLANMLVAWGAAVSSFFDKNVDCIVRGKTPSVFNGNLSTFSRSSSMVTRAKVKSGTSNIDKVANLWGISIISYDEIVSKLKGAQGLVPVNRPHKSFPRTCHYRVRQLRPPFIKVEDLSGKYRPDVKEFTRYPSLNLDSPQGCCPFEKNDPLPFENKKKKYKGEQASGSYCECCKVAFFTSLDQHLQSKEHLEFASNNSNYANLDAYIKSKKLDINTFVSTMRKKYQK